MTWNETNRKNVKLTFEDLNARYESFTSAVRCDCVFAISEMVGGQPADEEGVRQFVKHHLKIEDPAEQEAAVHRILTEEIQDVTEEEDELPEGKMHGLRSLRRTANGPYIGDWMIKACIKNAASRINLFTQKKGTKGNFSEAGRVQAIGASLVEPEQPNFIFMRNKDLSGPCETFHKEFMGRVQTPQGPTSIIHQAECVMPGTRFSFEFRFIQGKVNEDDLKDTFALAMIVGLGSARSLERGKFRISSFEMNIETPKEKETKKEQKVA